MATSSTAVGSDEPEINSSQRTGNANQHPVGVKPKRLVLCFDGTGNKFSADETDTNIVKIFEMLDRNTSDQYHYYQSELTFSFRIISARIEV
jgi:uncharacterized protein (DUF2235 family)